MKSQTINQSGNVMIIILVAVALFAALAFAFSQNSRTNIGFIEEEITNAKLVESTNCLHAAASAQKRLSIRGCEDISNETDMTLVADARCNLYHKDGGGVSSDCGGSQSRPSRDEGEGGGRDSGGGGGGFCDSVAIGSACPDGSIFAGTIGSIPYMTTLADAIPNGTFNTNWASPFLLVGANSDTDGEVNTAKWIAATDSAAPYKAAVACENLTTHGHSDWYLPSIIEIELFFTNKVALNINEAPYWSSTEANYENVLVKNMGTGDTVVTPKYYTSWTRCIRRHIMY